MKKVHFVLVVLLAALFACNQHQPTVEEPVEIKNPADPVPSQPCDDCVISETHGASKPIGGEYPIRNAKKIFTSSIKHTNYTQAQVVRLREAEKCIVQVMNDPAFKLATIAMSPFTSLSGNKAGMSNENVFDDIFKGAEALMPAVNYQMDLTVNMYYSRFSKVVGWTNPSIMIVHTNSKFHNFFSAEEIAGNLFHEWLHKLGYDHVSASDHKSVPYAMGYLMTDFCKKLLK
jgi:hypothetical protein